MQTIRNFVSNRFKDGESDVVGVTNSQRVINYMMNDWIETRMVQNVLSENNVVMNRDKNWVLGERIIGLKSKRVELFIRAQTVARFYGLNYSVWDKCLKQ